MTIEGNLNSSASGGEHKMEFFRPISWYFISGFLLVVLMPESFASDTPLLVNIVEFFKGWIPSISSLGGLSDFPVVTGLYLIFMWLLFPVAMLQFWLQMPKHPREEVPVKKLVLGCLSILAIVTATFIVLYYFPFDFDESDASLLMGRSGSSLYLITKLKLGCGLMMGLFFWLLIVIGSFLVFFTKYSFYRIYGKLFKV